MKLTLTLLLLAGCPKPAPTTPLNPWSEVPRLPSPSANTYTRTREPPTDPPLAALVRDHPWDGALSGAAAGLALDLLRAPGSGLTRWRVREALWRAGYAYPALDARAWEANPDGSPPEVLVDWLGGISAGDDLGLVRARGGERDLWVALRARPAADLGPLPRQVALGGTFALPAVPGASWVIADANGLVQRGTLDAPTTIEATSTGEWLVRIASDAGPIATFPVYVGIVPPKVELFSADLLLRTPTDAIGRAESLLADLRATYGATPLQRDFMLDAGARSMLRGDVQEPDAVKLRLGLDPEQTAMWHCRATTVEACLDAVLWTPEYRRALFDDASALGIAASVEPDGVHLTGIVARTRPD